MHSFVQNFRLHFGFFSASSAGGAAPSVFFLANADELFFPFSF